MPDTLIRRKVPESRRFWSTANNAFGKKDREHFNSWRGMLGSIARIIEDQVQDLDLPDRPDLDKVAVGKLKAALGELRELVVNVPYLDGG
jgi:hypothetical protein